MLEKLEELFIRFQELNQKLSEPDVIADRDLWQGLAKEHATLSEIMEVREEFLRVQKEIEDAEELLSSGDADLKEMAQAELEDLKPDFEQLEQKLKELLAPRDPDDDKNVVLEIRAGTGGEEAALFASDLLRMYSKYAEKKGWTFEITNLSDTQINGVKEAVCLVSGKEVFWCHFL